MRATACPNEDATTLQTPERVAAALLYLAESSDGHGQSLDMADLPVEALDRALNLKEQVDSLPACGEG